MTASFPFTKSEFIPEEVFKPFTDLDGKAAAEFLIANGVMNVKYRDFGMYGLAWGEIDGKTVTLSTNGFLNIKA